MGETEEAHHSSIDPPEGVDSRGCDGLIAGSPPDTARVHNTYILSAELSAFPSKKVHDLCGPSHFVIHLA